MAYYAIDVGSAATNRDSSIGDGYTVLDLNNPANANGVITSITMYAALTMSGVKVGTFTGSGTSWSLRDSETIANVSSGERTITTNSAGNPINITVSTGDVIGIYFTGGYLEKASYGGSSKYYTGDAFSAGAKTYTTDDEIYSLYCTGFTISDIPTNVSATDNLSNKVTITWTKVTGQNVTNYHVYRGSIDLGLTGDVSTFDDTGGTPGTTYLYTVKAVNAAGLSAASSADTGSSSTSGNISRSNSGGSSGYYSGDAFNSGAKTYTAISRLFSVYVTGYSAPDAPTNVSASENSTTKVTITWTKVSGQNVTDYRVFRDATDLGLAGDVSTFDDEDGTPGTTYAYTVKAISPAGEGTASTADNGRIVTISEEPKRSFISGLSGWPNNTILDDRWYVSDTYYFSNGLPPSSGTIFRRGLTIRSGSRL